MHIVFKNSHASWQGAIQWCEWSGFDFERVKSRSDQYWFKFAEKKKIDIDKLTWLFCPRPSTNRRLRGRPCISKTGMGPATIQISMKTELQWEIPAWSLRVSSTLLQPMRRKLKLIFGWVGKIKIFSFTALDFSIVVPPERHALHLFLSPSES